MLVTVIIPVYNAEKTIEECVRSVAEQSVQEILLIDDGSTDDTRRIVEKLAYPNLRFVCQNHAGASEARNRGIREATGDWLIFLDADDALSPEAVQNLTQAVNDRADACCGAIVRGCEQTPEEAGFAGVIHDPHELMNDVLSRPTDKLTIHGWIFKRRICTDHHVFFDPSLRIGEDSEFVLKYLAACRTVCFISAPVYRYTISNESTINNWKPGLTDAYLKTLSAIENTAVRNEKNWPLFVLTTLLLILTHDTFHPKNPAGSKERFQKCGTLRNLPLILSALQSADLTSFGVGKRITLACFKNRLYPIVLLAVKYRQRQNRLRSVKTGKQNNV